MVFSGTLDIARHLDLASSMPSLKTEALEIPNVEMVAAFFEIDDGDMEGLLPPALHPTIPPTVQFFGMKVTEGPLGAFSFAQVRVGCRAGVRPRGYTTLCFCDSAEASTALSERWGFPVQPGEVIVQRNYDRVQLVAEADGRRVLSVELMDPLPINGGDVQYTASVNLAKASHDGDEKPWLVQVDPDYAVRRADRARPTLHLFDAEAWAAEGVIPVYPITGSYTVSDMTLPALRYLMDPAKNAFAGTVSL
jgi:hypothetical protein